MTDHSPTSHNQTDQSVARAIVETLDRHEAGKPESDTRTVIMLSGGIDSVALLANLLCETEHQVYVHHVEMANRENRSRAENDAVADVIDYCSRHYRPFSFSSSKSEFRLTPRGYDLIITLMHAALVCLSLEKQVDFVMTGHFHTRDFRSRYGDGILRGCFISEDVAPKWLRPLDAMTDSHDTKKAIYRSVPHELAALGWSCRKPVRKDDLFVPCGVCYACRNLEQARAGAGFVR